MANKTKYLHMPNGDDFEFLGATYYGVCLSLASSQDKEVNVDGLKLDNIEDGVRIVVLMDSAQTYSGVPRLKVSDIGACPIRYTAGEAAGAGAWSAGEIVAFVFYDDYWIIEGGGASNEPCYQVGDTVSCSLFPVSGIITSSSKQVRLGLTVGKSLKNITTVTVTACTGGIRTVSGLLNNLSDPDWLSQTGVTVSASKVDDYHITLAIGSSSAFTNTTNNTVLALWPSALTFSFS